MGPHILVLGVADHSPVVVGVGVGKLPQQLPQGSPSSSEVVGRVCDRRGWEVADRMA